MGVTITFEGSPLLAKQAEMRVAVAASEEDANVDAVIARARDVSAVSNSIKRGIPVQIIAGG